MKICSKCKENKYLDEFYKEVNGKNGLRAKCKKCCNIQSKEYDKINLEKVKSKNENYRSINKNKLNDAKRIYYKNNKTKLCLKKNLYNEKHRYIKNASLAKYKANKFNASLSSFDKEIKAIYKEAFRLQKLDGIKRHVHHIIPLQEFNHLGIFGLHIPCNLQILTEQEHREAHRRLKEEFK